MRGATRTAGGREREAPLASSVGVDAAATGAVLGLHLGAVTHGALAVGLAGLLDGQVHGGAGSRLKRPREQVVGQPKFDRNATRALSRTGHAARSGCVEPDFLLWFRAVKRLLAPRVASVTGGGELSGWNARRRSGAVGCGTARYSEPRVTRALSAESSRSSASRARRSWSASARARTPSARARSASAR